MDAVPQEVLDVCRGAEKVVVLTGAGISAESGLATFRDPEVGLWERYDPMELASIDAWRADPETVWAWYLWRFERHSTVAPNAGHEAIARWEQDLGARVDVVTQNVDDLHERAGSTAVTHLHGNLTAFRCDSCGLPYTDPIAPLHEPVERLAPPNCHSCPGHVRPGVVWFGEMLPEGAFDHAVDQVQEADVVLSVGTSGIVYPAAMLPDLAGARDIPVVEINPNTTQHSDQLTVAWRSTAAAALPRLVAALLR